MFDENKQDEEITHKASMYDALTTKLSELGIDSNDQTPQQALQLIEELITTGTTATKTRMLGDIARLQADAERMYADTTAKAHARVLEVTATCAELARRLETASSSSVPEILDGLYAEKNRLLARILDLEGRVRELTSKAETPDVKQVRLALKVGNDYLSYLLNNVDSKQFYANMQLQIMNMPMDAKKDVLYLYQLIKAIVEDVGGAVENPR